MTDQDTDQIAPSGKEALANAWRNYDQTPEGAAARKAAEDRYAEAKITNRIALTEAEITYLDVRAAEALGGDSKPTQKEITAAIGAYTEAINRATKDLDSAYADTLGKLRKERALAAWSAYREARQSQQ